MVGSKVRVMDNEATVVEAELIDGKYPKRHVGRPRKDEGPATKEELRVKKQLKEKERCKRERKGSKQWNNPKAAAINAQLVREGQFDIDRAKKCIELIKKSDTIVGALVAIQNYYRCTSEYAMQLMAYSCTTITKEVVRGMNILRLERNINKTDDDPALQSQIIHTQNRTAGVYDGEGQSPIQINQQIVIKYE